MTKFEMKMANIKAQANVSNFLKTSGATAKYLGLTKKEVEKALDLGLIACRFTKEWNGKTYKTAEKYVVI